jgi:hypothetical protein
MKNVLANAVKQALIKLAIDDKLPADLNNLKVADIQKALKPILDEATDLINTVRTSCEEGYNETWDCSTEEGREGFNAMITLLDKAVGKLK